MMEDECLIESSRKLRSHSLAGLTRELSAALWQRTQLQIAMLFATLALVCAFGCSRTILVSEASPIRIGQVRGTVYASVDGEWRLSENAVTIPEGWYCVPPSFMDAIGNGDGTR
jgi:hypothetical protein